MTTSLLLWRPECIEDTGKVALIVAVNDYELTETPGPALLLLTPAILSAVTPIESH